MTIKMSYSPLDSRFAGSNPAEVDELFQSEKILIMTFLQKGNKAIGPV